MNIIVQRIFRNIKCPKQISHKLLTNHLCTTRAEDNIVSENQMKTILYEKFPNAKDIKVEDVSGGCGAMFNIYVETNEFKGLSVIKQHRLIYDVLKDQIKSIHGLHLITKTPS